MREVRREVREKGKGEFCIRPHFKIVYWCEAQEDYIYFATIRRPFRTLQHFRTAPAGFLQMDSSVIFFSLLRYENK